MIVVGQFFHKFENGWQIVQGKAVTEPGEEVVL